MINISTKASEILIETLMEKISDAEIKLSKTSNETFAIYMFMKNANRSDVLQDWIKFCYDQFPEDAKEFVAVFHDETLDLSTLECSSKDFKPWR